MPTPFCDKCYRKFMAQQFIRSNGGLAAYVEPREMVFGCKVPRFAYDSQGSAVVYVMDCMNDRVMVMPQKEYERRRATGEL